MDDCRNARAGEVPLEDPVDDGRLGGGNAAGNGLHGILTSKASV
jgi:hypothetical protein